MKAPKPRTVDQQCRNILALMGILYATDTERCELYGWAHSGIAHVTQSRPDASNGGRSHYDDGTPRSPIVEQATTGRSAHDRVARAAQQIAEAERCLRAALAGLQEGRLADKAVPATLAPGGYITRREHDELVAKQKARTKAGGGLGET